MQSRAAHSTFSQHLASSEYLIGIALRILESFTSQLYFWLVVALSSPPEFSAEYPTTNFACSELSKECSICYICRHDLCRPAGLCLALQHLHCTTLHYTTHTHICCPMTFYDHVHGLQVLPNPLQSLEILLHTNITHIHTRTCVRIVTYVIQQEDNVIPLRSFVHSQI